MSDDRGAAARNPEGGAKPPSGFTFADKRKIREDGAAAAPVAEPELIDAEPVFEADEAALGTGVADELAPPTDGLTAEEFRAEVDVNELLAAERLADLQRLQAEYANYRKRIERDRALSRDLTIASMVESLLPVLDDIQLARQHGDLESGPFASIADKLESTLAKYGVERFGEPGAAFDPSVHDALMHVEEELAEGTDVTTVVGVLQPGYRIGDKIIRPARVSVADPS
ncbi:MAG: nucleotide exchange factor GrpE [Actinomycetota bacterium]|nr:nucleotide exchange factor GrpE [Actinomycetota bacterium]MDQ2846913.1 nucleotide exchange factor GrpE [Actinomycetota bacterium]MDQ2958572.1 nucleotide exchange factor GrpE [Actinomycetota bacterium]